MARDPELDRLKAAQDRAFQSKQAAYQEQQRAWEKRDAARVVMNQAYEAKQRAWDAQNEAWQYLQRVRDRNGPRIDALNSLQETAYQNMRRAFDDASSAHERRDGASARACADQGHAYKAESQGYVAERRNLVAEIRSAKEAHEALRPAFQQAKSTFDACKQAFNTAKTEHERAQAAFQRAKAEFDAASAAFKTRLEKIRTERRRRQEDDKLIATRAGVMPEYLDNIKVRRNNDGSFDIFYGGAGTPDGLGHGHATLDRFGKATHDRRPFDSNSPENFADDASKEEFERSRGHSGGWGKAHHGYIDSKPVTFALGWGTKTGETLLADGHVDKATFHRSENHNHYGAGAGPNDNVRDRNRYFGSGA